ncbi:MAG: hypothetical protein JK586_02100 [Nocardiopsis sp. BM-2018]|nr:MAG: hypothetical protein JK586_02100 [Nocardiopsis sp. BM-2018]
MSDMFWALNGATRTPRRASDRHNPATRVLLPASDVVPHTINAPARPSQGAPVPDGTEDLGARRVNGVGENEGSAAQGGRGQ